MHPTTQTAQDVMPGGVSSPVRLGRGLLPKPPIFESAKGSYIYSDGQSYVDYVNGFGMHILGHQDPIYQIAMDKHLSRAVPGGVCHSAEHMLAQLLVDRVGPIEKVRFCVSGTEACMTALRLACHKTGKHGFVTIDGGYHGHSDNLIDNNNPLHIKVAFNDSESLENVIKLNHQHIGAVMIEPICGNMGMIKPQDGYLKKVASLCNAYNIILIADEVMTGFRTQYATVSELHDITPDLMCFAKIIGGGLPLACVAGRSEIMDNLAPCGPVTHAGTYASLSPCVLSGIEVLSYLQDNHYHQLSQQTASITQNLNEIASHYNVPIQTSNQGGMWGLFFAEHPVTCLNKIPNNHHNLYKIYYQAMFKSGIYLPPSSMEACFINLAHQQTELKLLTNAAKMAFRAVSEQTQH